MSVFERLELERAKYGALITAAQAVEILNAVAWTFQPDWGLYAAPAGGNGWPHPNGRVRLDILASKADGVIYDVFIDGPDASENVPGAAHPAWQDKGPIDPLRFVTPVKPIALPPGPPVAPPLAPPWPLDPTPPSEPTIAEEVLAMLLEPIGRIADAVEAQARANAAHVEELKQLRAEGLRIKFR